MPSPPFLYDDARFTYDEQNIFYDGGVGCLEPSTIDPLSVATHGFIINDLDKIIIPLTIGTLGWIKPEREVIEIGPVRTRGGSRHLQQWVKPPKAKELEEILELEIKICIDLTAVNGKSVTTFDEITKKYFIKHGPVEARISKIKHRKNKTEVFAMPTTNSSVEHSVVVEGVESKPTTPKAKISGSNVKIKSTKQLFNIKLKKKK